MRFPMGQVGSQLHSGWAQVERLSGMQRVFEGWSVDKHGSLCTLSAVGVCESTKYRCATLPDSVMSPWVFRAVSIPHGLVGKRGPLW